jgi:hypothetical protein
VRESNLKVLVEFVDPSETKVPLGSESNLRLHGSKVSEYVLSSPVEEGGLSADALDCLVDIIHDLVNMGSLGSVSVVASKSELLSQDISKKEVITSSILKESLSKDCLHLVVGSIMIELDADVVVLVVNAGGSLEGAAVIGVVPEEVKSCPETDGTNLRSADFDGLG